MSASETNRTFSAGTAAASPAGTPAGTRLGDYVVGAPLWRLRIADGYQAQRGVNGQTTAAMLYIVHPAIAANADVRQQLIEGVRTAAALPAHPNVVKTIAAGLTGDVLWVAVESTDGNCLRDLLAAKPDHRFDPKIAGNLGKAIAGPLATMAHGAFASESVVINRQGVVRIADFALARGTAAAMSAKLIAGSGAWAPEITAGSKASESADVYGLGALLYEVLVGGPLRTGGPRPSEAVPGTSQQIDEVIARACHRDPPRRFGSLLSFGEVISEALGQGGALTELTRAIGATPTSTPLPRATPVTTGIASAAPKMQHGSTTNPHTPAPITLRKMIRDPALEKALAAAMTDTSEKWLVTKKALDYGPFSLADVVQQIDKGEIVADHIIADKDTGARAQVGEHPLLGAMVAQAQQRINDARRAQAEVSMQTSAKRAGAALYVTIALGVAAAAVAVYFVVQKARGSSATKVETVSTLGAGSLSVNVSLPKAPPKRPKTGAGGNTGTRTNDVPANGSEDLTLDMSGDDEESSPPLEMSTVYNVYSRAGGALGGCLQANGERSANIFMIIDGPSGKVTLVRVNGKNAGGLQGCISRTMRGLKFPAAGSRTKAEFEISM